MQITNPIWERLKDFLTNCQKVHVGNPEKCRLFFSAILWLTEKNCTWNTLPNRFGNWRSVYSRFNRWCSSGVFELLHTHFHTDEEISNILSPLYTGHIYSQSLKTRIKKSLESQGFKIEGNQICLPENRDKGVIRGLHTEAVQHKIEACKKGLIEHEPSLLQRFASGEEVVIDKINPKLIEVPSGSKEALLFRYIGLHWSIPVSSGYGRRIRYPCSRPTYR